ncbi:MAG: GGDEF domain-containing protein [Magnetococcales bacterium]|nr:GGDEF domain-containing protein [Magnetococcales bacterium]
MSEHPLEFVVAFLENKHDRRMKAIQTLRDFIDSQENSEQEALDLVIEIMKVIESTKNDMGLFGDSMDESMLNIDKSADIHDLSELKNNLLSSAKLIKTKSSNMITALDETQEQFKEMEKQLQDVGQELEKAQEQTLTDGLTGLYNRMAFDEAISREVKHSISHDQPLSLIMFDLDYFKRINDKFGHQGGDEVLRVVAARAKELLRKSDFLARYGGEEFALLLPHTEIEAATKVANKLRSTISRKPVKHEENTIFVRASLGVCQYITGKQGKDLIECSDQALYKAKENGRNCVFVGE